LAKEGALRPVMISSNSESQANDLHDLHDLHDLYDLHDIFNIWSSREPEMGLILDNVRFCPFSGDFGRLWPLFLAFS
jgi:hypothetical protein